MRRYDVQQLRGVKILVRDISRDAASTLKYKPTDILPFCRHSSIQHLLGIANLDGRDWLPRRDSSCQSRVQPHLIQNTSQAYRL
jgi:hypothetical protein